MKREEIERKDMKKNKVPKLDLAFDYMFEGPVCERYKKLSVQVTQAVPDLKYIEPNDFGIIIAKLPPPMKADGKVLAEMCYPTHWLRQYTEWALKMPLPPYIMIIYPAIFHMSFKEKIQLLIHELFHIRENKRGIRPHMGFGDEAVTRMYANNIRRLEKIGK